MPDISTGVTPILLSAPQYALRISEYLRNVTASSAERSNAHVRFDPGIPRGLGFKIDATSEKKFVEGVQNATQRALALGAAMQAVAATITAAVVKIARDMDQMAYASKRLGSSVKDI